MVGPDIRQEVGRIPLRVVHRTRRVQRTRQGL
jgi:hypothetical protein